MPIKKAEEQNKVITVKPSKPVNRVTASKTPVVVSVPKKEEEVVKVVKPAPKTTGKKIVSKVGNKADRSTPTENVVFFPAEISYEGITCKRVEKVDEDWVRKTLSEKKTIIVALKEKQTGTEGFTTLVGIFAKESSLLCIDITSKDEYFESTVDIGYRFLSTKILDSKFPFEVYVG